LALALGFYFIRRFSAAMLWRRRRQRWLSRVITSYYGARSFLLRRAIISLYFTQLCAALFDNSDYRFLDASKVSAAAPSQSV
jgi:hypothetical protein